MLAMVGTLIMSSGVVLMTTATTAQATKGEDHKVYVCHATESDTNPYVVIHVDKASTKYQGHLAHRTTPNKQWKQATTWNGSVKAAGSNKPDLIEGLDFEGYPGFCEAAAPPDPENPKVTAVAPNVELSTACDVQGSYIIPNTAGVQYRLNGVNIAPGEYDGPASGTVTAVPTGDATLTNANFSFHLSIPAAEKCPDPKVDVTPVPYGTTDPTCKVDGSLVAKSQPQGVTATQSPAGTGPGTYTITFAAGENYVLKGEATQTITVLPKLTGYECDEVVEPTPVKPVQYGTTAPTCEVDGSLVVKNQPQGVTATQSPAGTGPGTYTITFTAAKDFVLAGKATQQVTVLPKLTGDECDDEGGADAGEAGAVRRHASDVRRSGDPGGEEPACWCDCDAVAGRDRPGYLHGHVHCGEELRAQRFVDAVGDRAAAADRDRL